jgi:hypothetical protein
MNKFLATCAVTATIVMATVASRADEVFPVVHTDSITVRVLDGRDGKPQAWKRVVLVGGYDRRDLSHQEWRQEALTDSAGLVHLSSELTNLPWLRLDVLQAKDCGAETGPEALSVERIRTDGLSSANRCGRITAADAPGVFTVFVQPHRQSKKAARRAARAPAAALIPAPVPAAVAQPGLNR